MREPAQTASTAVPLDPAAECLREHVAHLAEIDQWYWWHRVRFRAVRWGVRRFGPPDVRRHVDVGAGGGGLARFLCEESGTTDTVLVDQFPIDLARVGVPAARYVQMDIERGDWPSIAAPDVVTCLDVFEHLQDPEALLCRLREAWGAAGTVLIATVPAMPMLWSPWDVSAGHRRRYTRPSLEALLGSAGWSVRFCGYLFHGLMLPAMLGRWIGRQNGKKLEFPVVPRWANVFLERLFWLEFLALRCLALPFGCSLLVIASASSQDAIGRAGYTKQS